MAAIKKFKKWKCVKKQADQSLFRHFSKKGFKMFKIVKKQHFLTLRLPFPVLVQTTGSDFSGKRQEIYQRTFHSQDVGT